jgi:phenylacetate-CoA ligase
MMPGQSACGRTNTRIKGWMGRADQTTKVKGMFVRPEQVAALVAKHPDVARARVVVDREGETDVLHVLVETLAGNVNEISQSVHETLKLKGRVEICAMGSLPRDGIVIEDRRKYD